MASFGLAFTRDGTHLIVGGASSEIFLLKVVASWSDGGLHIWTVPRLSN
jgi:hypothetical protein